ncbi:MAG: hypothetical protein IJB06_03580 [Bacteroidales bacterium]|nr:hypothetical protein [Bacteroidales bacterium]
MKKIGIYAGIILLFLVISYGYVPEVLSGKIVNQSDIASWKGMANEAMTHNGAHPEDPTAWTNSMFGGMPTTATIDSFEGDWTDRIYDFLLTGRRPATYLFIALVGGFLLMLSMGINGIVAVAGAIAIAFCSYNMQIIQVGHNTKMQAIAYFPWVLAGVIFTYRTILYERLPRRFAPRNDVKDRLSDNGVKNRHSNDDVKEQHSRNDVKEQHSDVIARPSGRGNLSGWLPKTVLGATLFAFALSMQIKANHVQITYYLAIVIAVYVIALFISLCANKEKRHLIGRFFIASGLLLIIGLVGIATNANKLIPTYEYTEYTMRGGSELSGSGAGHSDSGLDLEYATAWSYGIEEMPNLLIPNFNGGSSSGELSMSSETAKLLKRAGQPNLRQVIKHMPLYWGPQPFTAGPMYMGAISIFLFVLGLFLCKGREKWWMLAATVIAVLLSWGSHFMWFTKLWFDHAPMYNKFRTVSMALIVLQVNVPLLGFYTLDRILKEKYTSKEFGKAALPAYLLTGVFCLACALVPGIAGSFTGAADAGQPDILTNALAADRQALLKKDAWTSFWMISVTAALLMWAFRTPKRDAVGKEGSFVRKGRMAIVAAAMIILVSLDLMPVGKRYLNKEHFVTKKDFSAQYEPRPVDEMILADEDLDYRVLDISVNTFNSSIPSYHHKTIGGYSPVKLQRYQDLIERYITGEIHHFYDVIENAETVSQVQENMPELKVISMLNGRYIILGGEYPPVVNTHAYGNAWFVSGFVPAATPDDEIALLASTDLKTTAVIGDDFKWAQEAFAGFPAVISSEVEKSPSITLTHYAPNELRYAFSTDTDRAAVFSEIYYPKGWKAWIEPAGAYGEVRGGRYQPTGDGKPVDLFRADWMLRGAVLPEGEGQLIMRFEPESYKIGEKVSRASSILLILLLIGSSAGMFLASRRKEK